MDTSALLKRYIEEPQSAEASAYLLAESRWITARHTYVEARRNLSRLLVGDGLAAAVAAFERDWERFFVIEVDAITCESAATIAEMTGARTLDALHLAAARRVGGDCALLTYDIRQAQAARMLGILVRGA